MKEQKPDTYRYCILPGNESVLMKEAMERRPWWAPAGDSNGSRWNFWWGGNGQPFDFKTFSGGEAGLCLKTYIFVCDIYVHVSGQ